MELRSESPLIFFIGFDKYWHEDFHEINLMQILNPKTPEICKIAYLEKFLELIAELSGRHFVGVFEPDDVIVENQFPVKNMEENGKGGRIDILIHDGTKAITEEYADTINIIKKLLVPVCIIDSKSKQDL